MFAEAVSQEGPGSCVAADELVKQVTSRTAQSRTASCGGKNSDDTKLQSEVSRVVVLPETDALQRGAENYREAVRQYRELLAKDPANESLKMKVGASRLYIQYRQLEFRHARRCAGGGDERAVPACGHECERCDDRRYQ